MKKLLFFLFLPASLWAFQKPAKTTPATKDQGGTLTLVCKIIDFPANADSLTIYEYAGLTARPVMRAGRRADSSFVFTLPRSNPRYYGVGMAENGLGRVILGEEPAVTLWANAQYMDKARTVNSPANKAYETMRRRVEAFRLESETHRNTNRQAVADNNVSLQKAISERFARLAATKTRYLDSLKTANPLVWRSATLLIAPDPEAEKNPKAYPSEIDFWSKEYFRYANLSDRGYDETPEIYEAFETYARIVAPLADAKSLAEAQLAKLPANSKAHRMALGGLVSGFKAAKNALYPVFAQQYLTTYRNQSYGEIGRLEFELNRAGASTPGMMAPNLIGQTPDSQSLSLAQLRGKYVLIDFWASWCGPCRRENPNVRVLYEKYHDKGFEILGVSLDRERGAWIKAIEADGLRWPQISDLKGWNSEHAKIYNVTSIPKAILLDREGKIVAHENLRGEELKKQLVNIFGE